MQLFMRDYKRQNGHTSELQISSETAKELKAHINPDLLVQY